ncbi:hypothetical protein GCM10022631_08920 [Deinococcus rubellus]
MKGIEDIGHDEPDGAGFALAQAAGQNVGLVTKLLRGLHHACTGAVGDHLRAAQCARGRGCGDFGEGSDILNA